LDVPLEYWERPCSDNTICRSESPAMAPLITIGFRFDRSDYNLLTVSVSLDPITPLPIPNCSGSNLIILKKLTQQVPLLINHSTRYKHFKNVFDRMIIFKQNFQSGGIVND
jgi:hypothetical protein